MWEPAGRFFYTGSNDGATINPSPLPEDPQSWSYLALQDSRYAAALDWAKTNLATTDTPQSANARFTGNLRFSGVTFSNISLRVTTPSSQFDPPPDPDAVWFEGTAHIAAALLQRKLAQSRSAELRWRREHGTALPQPYRARPSRARQGRDRKRRPDPGRHRHCLGVERAQYRLRLFLFPAPAYRRNRLVSNRGAGRQSVSTHAQVRTRRSRRNARGGRACRALDNACLCRCRSGGDYRYQRRGGGRARHSGSGAAGPHGAAHGRWRIGGQPRRASASTRTWHTSNQRVGAHAGIAQSVLPLLTAA